MVRTGETGRFVILKHDWPEPHRDLILELPDTIGAERLPTWALYPIESSNQAEQPILSQASETQGMAVRLEDHRRVYLDYEGMISGGRGKVTRECSGVISDCEECEGAGFSARLRMTDTDNGSVAGRLTIARSRKNHVGRNLIPPGRAAIHAEIWTFVWSPEPIAEHSDSS